MRCCAVGCKEEALYRRTVEGSYESPTEFEVVVCRQHYLAGWHYSYLERKQQEEEILKEAERI